MPQQELRLKIQDWERALKINFQQLQLAAEFSKKPAVCIPSEQERRSACRSACSPWGPSQLDPYWPKPVSLLDPRHTDLQHWWWRQAAASLPPPADCAHHLCHVHRETKDGKNKTGPQRLTGFQRTQFLGSDSPQHAVPRTDISQGIQQLYAGGSLQILPFP